MMGKKTVIDMDRNEARNFFLKSESYFNVPLPDYFDLNKIIENAEKIISKGGLNTIENSSDDSSSATKVIQLKDISNVNVKIMANKDSSYSWRQFTLIHPIIYVDLVNTITEDQNWKKLCDRFSEFQKNDKIICTSIPVESANNQSDTKEQILRWWQDYEQAQIKLALDFAYCIHTDISDCYPSVYTHTIPWAIHGKEWAKKHRDRGLGNKLDKKIRNLQNGQTNGIPQGSVLMDLIAEIILGYADENVLTLAKNEQLEDFKILRYRDDYRIFSNKKDVAERVMKILSEVLLDLNFKINSKKTFLSEDLIISGIKPDKLYWNSRNSSFLEWHTKFIKENNIYKKIRTNTYKINLQKHLLEIKMLGDKFPNCGQLNKALRDFYMNRINKLDSTKDKLTDVYQLISVATSIMLNNPKTIQHCVAILHKLLEFIEKDDEKEEIINLILKKYESIPNADLVEIWIQNISVRINRDKIYKNPLSQKVINTSNNLWDCSWLKLDKKLDESSFIDEEIISELQPEYSLIDFNTDSD